jgi:hypothetical protein
LLANSGFSDRTSDKYCEGVAEWAVARYRREGPNRLAERIHVASV